ncbi:hypothetical protein HRbin08_00271 [bacterium HR08]|nr:hypothetical protein HRbin08_00271 [bacterium HR08]
MRSTIRSIRRGSIARNGRAVLCGMIGLALLCVAGTAAAQTPAMASVSGVVTDPAGNVVAGASVSIRNLDTGILQQVETNERGVYQFVSLPPGRYELKVEAVGFATSVIPEVRLTVGQAAVADVTLKVGAVQETIEVTAPTPLVEPTRTSLGQVLEERQVHELPINTRNFVQLTLITPKVVPASAASGRGAYMGDRYKENQFSFSGLRYQFNYQTVDGASSYVWTANVVKSFYSLETVKEFRVLNSLYTVEQGHAMGGIITVITRSGTNEWHGTLYEFLRNDKLDKTDILTTPGFSAFRRNQFGAAVGGPLVRDRFFFFGNYEGQRQAKAPRFPAVYLQNLDAINAALARLGFPPETPYVLQTADSDQFLLRFDAPLSPAHNLMGRYNFYNTDNENDRIGASGVTGEPITMLAARHHRLRDQGVVLSLNSTPSSRWVNAAVFGFEKHRYRLDPRPGVPLIELAVIGAFSTGVEAADEQGLNERRFHLSDTLTYLRGHHQFKFGVEYLRTDVSNHVTPGSLAIVPGLSAFLAPEPIVAQVRIHPEQYKLRLHMKADQFGFFLQDQWQARRGLTVTYGVRYDVERIRGIIALSEDDVNNVQPRVGFAYAFGARHPTVIRGGYGIFISDRYHPYLFIDGFVHGTNFPSFNDAYRAANPFVRKYKPLPDTVAPLIITGAGPATAAFKDYVLRGIIPSGPAALFVVISAPDLPNPYAQQWSLEVERQVTPSWAVTIGYSGLRSFKLPLLINHNLRPAVAKLPSGKNDYQAQLYDPRFGVTYIGQPFGYSIYHAGTLTVRRMFARHIGLTANYVFSRAIDNGAGNSTFIAPEDPYNTRLDRALSAEHAKHRFTLSLMADAPASWPGLRGFGVRLLAIAQSPRYFNVTAGSDLNRDLNAVTDRPDVLGRNTWRGDDYVTFDLRILRRFQFRERYGLEAVVEFYNLFNRVNITDLFTVWGRPTLAQPPIATFNTPRAVGDAFKTQLALKFTF